MAGFWDGSCPVCGGHIYGRINDDRKRTPWKCNQCGASEDNPVFDENKEISWSVACYGGSECAEYRTKQCLECKKCAEVDFPWFVRINGNPVDIRNEIVNGISYKKLAERGTVEIIYMSYVAETRIIYDGDKWIVRYNYD